MVVGVVQLNSNDNIENNLKLITQLIEADLKLHPETKFFILPENSLFFRIKEGSAIKSLNLSSPEILTLKKFCEKHFIYIHLTTAIFENSQTWNASVLLSPSEMELPKIIYKKVHLFDIQLDGQKPIKESDFFSYGNEVTQFEVENIKFGSSICYDLRFSELYKKHSENLVDVILVPSAFLVKTGQAHWETLLRARAIENQCYVLAPAQEGVHHSEMYPETKRETYGHSMVIDPWGKIETVLKHGFGIIHVSIDKEYVQRVRLQIPMAQHRRL